MDTNNYRFNIVVLNYNRLWSFFNNFHKIANFNPETDIVTIVTSSPSAEEMQTVKAFENEKKITVHYLPRKNKGIDQYARIQYFLGELGRDREHLKFRYIFQMQEHYLDATSAHSKWGPELDNRIKGDVVPDDIVFDLDEIDAISRRDGVSTFFCDRNNPSFFSVNGSNYIAPNGGNFIFVSNLLRDPGVIDQIKYLKRTFVERYDWAVFTEHFWGEIFFRPGLLSFDYKRRKLFSSFQKGDFYQSPDDYIFLRKWYSSPLKTKLRKMKNSVKKSIVRFTKLIRPS